MSMKVTRSARAGEFEQKWYVLDASDIVLGRAATQIAMILRGKNKATFTPHADTGDFVVVVNADKVSLTGKKMQDKTYYWHSLYPGGIKSRSAQQMLATKPEEVWQRAVYGMLPKNRLGKQLIKKLKVYAGPDHPHQAQQPQPLPGFDRAGE